MSRQSGVALAGRAQLRKPCLDGPVKTEQRLEQRKSLDEAKGVLMDDFAMGEQGAVRFPQTTAMSRRSTTAQVARRKSVEAPSQGQRRGDHADQ
ncbi:MAG: ANTAR domain-containing protein [Candidatus Microthrix sp.]|nr:ANTAR domain-containing protein [Candidatus Microthrix sp.]MBK7021529.1 ANTAR domain-containing protein [Candidatus Microthrix sp.]